MAKIYSAMGLPPTFAAEKQADSQADVISCLERFCSAVNNGALPHTVAETLPPAAQRSGVKAAESLRDYDTKYDEGAGLELIRGNTILGRAGAIELVNRHAAGLVGSDQDRGAVADALGLLLTALNFSGVIAITMD